MVLPIEMKNTFLAIFHKSFQRKTIGDDTVNFTFALLDAILELLCQQIQRWNLEIFLSKKTIVPVTVNC